MGRAFDGAAATPLWLGGALALAAVLALGAPAWAFTVPAAALLLVTGSAWEAAVAAALLGAATALAVPQGTAAAIAGTGLVLCVAGSAVEKRYSVGRVWHHAGWALGLVALLFLRRLDATQTPIALVAAAGCAWCVASRTPKLEWLAWAGTVAAAHGLLGFAGLRLSDGLPAAVLLPWASAVSTLLSAVALFKAQGSTQRSRAGVAACALAVLELLAGAVLLDGSWPREAVVGALAMALVTAALLRQALTHDDVLAAFLAQLACTVAFVAVAWLGFEHASGITNAFAGLFFGALLGAAGRPLAERGLHDCASASRLGATLWPLIGVLGVPLRGGSLTLVLLLLAQSAHFAALARGRAWRRGFATLSALCFNAALAYGWEAAEQHRLHFLLIPFGLSALVLLNVFKGDLAPATLHKLRAAAVTVIYGAAAFEPLAFPSPWALWLCAVVCVAGVAFGVALRVRSWVFLGTGFLVTTVVASLTRYGIQQPRVGALLLSALGLLVVAFMVLVTTRRAELLERYHRARSLLAQWQA
jgi:hypothetical protein